MKMIEEMRKMEILAQQLEVSGYAEMYKRWADILEQSGALVPVKDGEPCEMDYTERYHFIVWNEHVCVPDKLRWMLVRITDNYRYDVASLCAQSHKFQPVRLVPITEAEL